MSDIELIDSHCHLIFENFEKDLEDVVLRLRSKGVKKLVHACCELTEIPKLKKISYEFQERSEGADEILIWIPQTSVALGSLIFFICVSHQLVLKIQTTKND